ncbi:hypothetical protein TCCBUS3UF1_p40 (plasmid) [Thermus sp. CCB_US3_UF1]|uniref:hypothetical protein n=1 Tax=Thermus sp. CCB_US3_UF1 TaxID=1111069 RepID=UPI00023893F1|nr:hypothetical protein [Thermus sp. CCB_US3_UF1]AEV17301.1 hypothetical protein TCCBUS3UF1_p40 [Thermus sp. CCB_US3_UF1]
MKELSTQAQVQVLSREGALSRAAWALIRARERVVELYGWFLAGETDSYLTPFLLARDIAEAVEEAKVLAISFAILENFSESATAFLEQARLEAARILAEKSAGEEVPF